MGAQSDGIGKGTTFFFVLPVYSSHAPISNGFFSGSDQKNDRNNGHNWKGILSFGDLLLQRPSTNEAAAAVSHSSLGTPPPGNAAAYHTVNYSGPCATLDTPNQKDRILSFEKILKPNDSPLCNSDLLSPYSPVRALFQKSVSAGNFIV